MGRNGHAERHVAVEHRIPRWRNVRKEDIDARLPWLYDFKLDFQFK